jgi:hypothetical protein
VEEHKVVYMALQIIHYILEKQFTNDMEGRKALLRASNVQIIELIIKEVEFFLE